MGKLLRKNNTYEKITSICKSNFISSCEKRNENYYDTEKVINTQSMKLSFVLRSRWKPNKNKRISITTDQKPLAFIASLQKGLAYVLVSVEDL